MFFFFPLAEKKQAWYNFFMKILHCSDIHLESKLSALPHNKALLRRGEILESFCSLMRQAYGCRLLIIRLILKLWTSLSLKMTSLLQQL